MMIDGFTTLDDALVHPEAAALLRAEVPDLVPRESTGIMGTFPLRVLLSPELGTDPARAERLLRTLQTFEHPRPRPPEPPAPIPSNGYEGPNVERGSATMLVPSGAVAFEPVELTLEGPDHGNPFIDVELTASVQQGSTRLSVGGFYDGDGRYRIRFLPERSGTWTVFTTSNARSLDGVRGAVEVAQPITSARGPVRVVGRGFARPDGSAFIPVGTTAYAWTHQPQALQEQTLAALSASPFNKLRMGLFPKSFLYNANDPELYVFPRREDGSWDLERFDLAYFNALEHRLLQLREIGIEADLILFHPYDRWGFSDLGRTVDDRYVQYVVRRFAAFPHVWWSLANEYELVAAKRNEDWHRIGRLVASEDHVGHPTSVHNIVEPWDADAEWVTHCSIQRGDPSIGHGVDGWRRRWTKPIVVDEMGYEGDLDQGWGSLTAQEMVERCWQVVLRGGYFTHGETFWSEDEVVFWAKGGDLVGESPARIAFLRRIVAESPTGQIDALQSDFDALRGGVAGRQILLYLGRGRPRFRNITIPNGHCAEFDVIDTWNMTITKLAGHYRGTAKIDLPRRPHMLIRMRLAPDPGEVVESSSSSVRIG